MNNGQLQKHIREVAKDTARVFFTEHCLDRMLSRGVTDVQVIECLRYGVIERPPKWDKTTQELKCQMAYFGSYRNISVVVALDVSDPDIVVVTVMKKAAE